MKLMGGGAMKLMGGGAMKLIGERYEIDAGGAMKWGGGLVTGFGPTGTCEDTPQHCTT